MKTNCSRMEQYCRLLRSHVLGAKAGRKGRQKKTGAREQEDDIYSRLLAQHLKRMYFDLCSCILIRKLPATILVLGCGDTNPNLCRH
jgi:hypothetical protein